MAIVTGIAMETINRPMPLTLAKCSMGAVHSWSYVPRFAALRFFGNFIMTGRNYLCGTGDNNDFARCQKLVDGDRIPDTTAN